MARKIEKRIIYIGMALFGMITNLKTVNAYGVKTVTTSVNNATPQLSAVHIILLAILLITGFILILFVSKVLNSTKINPKTKESHLNSLTDKEIEKIDKNLNITILQEQTFSFYKKLETIKTKPTIKNLKELKEVVTEDLYQEEEQEINLLKENKQKVVATNIQLENFKVLSIEPKKDIENILTYLHVSQYDYIIDKNKDIVRGTDESVYQIEYKITLEKTSDNQYKIKKKECVGKWIKN